MSSTVTRIGAIVCELLNISDANPEDDFLDLGGASLSAVHLAIEVEERFGVQLPLIAIFDNPTVGGIADEVDRRLAE